jgi:protein tyrosine/serine phosphatase
LWIDLDGADNVRDVGGLPTLDGQQVEPGRLIRSDSLQELTDRDVRHLVDDLHVRAIADLRTGKELEQEGPDPMTREASVRVEHYSLYPELGETTDLAAADAVALGFQEHDRPHESIFVPSDDRAEPTGATSVYLRYLDDRSDSIIASLRLIAHSDGATIVHCAAGKDRTGVIVALALREVGVTPEAIAEDYARTAARFDAVQRRLGKRPAYADDVAMSDPERQKPRAATMEKVLAAIDERHGGVGTWLRAHGWTDTDAAALRAKLLAPQPA